ncbi:MAG: ABC transporter permease [Campylobacter sp.]|nr:ABC transporter permease [Campylobacter sp.]
MELFKRFCWTLFSLLLFSVVLFFMIYTMPSDITSSIFARPEGVSPMLKAKIESELGLDRPFLVQYLAWLKGVMSGDFGTSLIDGRDVWEIVSQRFANSIVLNGLNLLLTFVVSLALGVISAIYADKFIDGAVSFVSFGFFCMPSFWVGVMAILVFSLEFGWFPTSGLNALGDESFVGRLNHLVLPLLVLFITHLGIYIRIVRSSFLSNLNEEFVLAMMARGINKFQIYKVVLKHSLTPIISYFGTTFASLITGSYVIERVFSYPGLGDLVVGAILSKDYPVIMCVVLITSIFAVFGNFLASVICAFINRGRA